MIDNDPHPGILSNRIQAQAYHDVTMPNTEFPEHVLLQ